MADKPRLSIRIDIGPARFGPGKAALLRAISQVGSISGAARELGMSYRKAWGLVEELNGILAEPLVVTTTGGRRQGGAQLTRYGEKALAIYDAVSVAAHRGAAKPLSQIKQLAG